MNIDPDLGPDFDWHPLAWLLIIGLSCLPAYLLLEPYFR